MSERTLLKIGEFARVGRVSIATLRYYEKAGLLRPSALDQESGYRYYTLDQLLRLNRIAALKDLGFPLQEIARLLEEDLSLEQLREMFRKKQEYIQQVVEAERARLVRVAARLRQIEQEGSMPVYDMLLKQVEPLLIASIRERMSVEDDIGLRYDRIFRYLDERGVSGGQPHLLVRHSRFELRDDGMYADVEAAVPLPSPVEGNELINVRTLPGGLMACTVHIGDALFLGQAYMALHRWMEENGYRIVGPPRQMHLQRVDRSGQGESVTEVQFPVVE